jgi:hypothetical protein
MEKQMTIKTISFAKLTGVRRPTVVMVGLKVKPSDLAYMNTYFKGSGLITSGEFVEMKSISGNVLGDRGRHDVLIIGTKDLSIDPLKRLQFGDIKWTSDFVVNFAQDYEQSE